MSREKLLMKNTIILSIGTFLPKISSMIVLPILTGYLTAKEYGTYDLIVTLIALLLPAITLQIQSAAFRFLIDSRGIIEDSKSVITNIFFFSIPISIVTSGILFVFLSDFNEKVRLLISIYFVVDIVLVALRQIARGLGLNYHFSISSVLNSFFLMLMIIIELVFLNNGLIGVLYALITSTAISIIYLCVFISILKYISLEKISILWIKKMLKYSWPLVPNNLSMWVLSLSDRLVITYFLGLEATAIYAVANKIPNMLKLFQSTFLIAWHENATLSVKDDDSSEYYSKMFDIIFSFLSGAMSILIMLTPLLFNILIRGDYDIAYQQMSILYLGIFCSSIAAFLGGIYMAHMKTRSAGLSTVVAALVNIIIDLVLIERIGMYAASISTMLSYLLLAAYRMFDIKKFQNINYNFKKIIASVIILILMSILSYQQQSFFDMFNVIISFIFTYFLNYELLGIVKSKLLPSKK